MKLFREEDSRAKKGIAGASAVAAALSLLLLAGNMITGPREPEPRPAAKRETRPQRPRPGIPQPMLHSGPPAPLPPPKEAKEFVEDLDRSNVRQYVRTLMEAAAAENAPLRASMLGAIGRYRASARPVIESELPRASLPAVRQALQEALAKAR